MVSKQYEKLLLTLSLKKQLSLKEAIDLLGVSESTVRRLFIRLEKDGKAMRTHGGIRDLGPIIRQYDFKTVAETNINKKMAIAREAVKHVEDDDVIFCDSGTTMQGFCSELGSRIREEKLKVQIYTNSLENLELLASVTDVTLLGGIYRKNRQDFCGFLTEESLKIVHFDKCFIGADACIDGEKFATTDYDTARVNLAAQKNSSRCYMLVDSSKFYTVAHVIYLTLHSLDCLITDDGINQELLKKMHHSHLRVICVPEIINGQLSDRN